MVVVIAILKMKRWRILNIINFLNVCQKGEKREKKVSLKIKGKVRQAMPLYVDR